MEWNGIKWNEMEYMEWNGIYGIKWWNKMEWNGAKRSETD